MRAVVPEYDAQIALAAADEYNLKIAKIPAGTKDPSNFVTDAEYLSQLTVAGRPIAGIGGVRGGAGASISASDTGAMAELVIPKIKVDLPVYHGTGAYALEHGVGHLYGSSLPVGGDSTHTVLTAHAGIPGNELFTRLSELEIDDEFSIFAAGQAILYRVNDIRTVLPDEVESLAVVSHTDLATLVTCTPIGINSHRLLVTGTRISDEITGPVTPPSRWTFPLFIVIFLAGTGVAFISGRKLFAAKGK